MESPRTHLSDSLQIFSREISETEATVYVQTSAEHPDLAFSGAVQGPYCELGRTLPTRCALAPAEGRPGMFAAQLIDPCFWSPAYPAYYRVHLESPRKDGGVEAIDTMLGLRRLRPFKRNLYRHGSRWVLRGVHREGVSRQELQQLHDTSATLVTSCLDEATCILASTMGVLIVARLGGDAADIATRLRGLANYPAVGLAIIESKTVIQADLRREAPNIVLLARADADHLMSPPAWVGAFVSDCGTLERRPSWLGTLPNPVLAERLLAPTYRLSIPAARAACDRLQRDLAPEFDLAGYIV